MQTVTGSHVKVLGKVNAWAFSSLATNIVDEVILGMNIMNIYGFVMDLRDNVLRVSEDKIQLCMAKLTGSADHSTKQVTVAEEEHTCLLYTSRCV